MKLVVTGALGHIGSRLIRQLPDFFKNAEIVLVDDLSTQRYCSLFNLPKTAAFHFLEADILKISLDDLFKGADAVVHLAAITDATQSFQNKERVELVNSQGTEKVASACARVGTPLIFISTTSVYGTQAEVVDEDCSPDDLKPQSPYAEAKLKAERMLTQMGTTQGLRFITCRFGTIFGTSVGMRFHTAINKFCWQAAMGQPITVWRTALNQKRPYLDLSDAIAALVFIIERKAFDNRVYNIVTVNTTVQKILDCISPHIPKLRIEYVDTAIMNQLSYEVRAERFKSLGFKIKGSLEQGIAQTLELLPRC